MPEKFITGIDLGSSNIKVAVAAFNPEGTLQIVSATEEVAEGINKGIITNLEEAVTSLSRALERAERMIGTNIERAIIGISGTHIITQPSRGVVAVANARGEIREEDVERVLEGHPLSLGLRV